MLLPLEKLPVDASYVNGQTISVEGGFTAAGLRVKNL